MGAGGKRPGAGRPRLDDDERKVALAFKVIPDASEALAELAAFWKVSKRVALERAIMQAHHQAHHQANIKGQLQDQMPLF